MDYRVFVNRLLEYAEDDVSSFAGNLSQGRSRDLWNSEIVARVPSNDLDSVNAVQQAFNQSPVQGQDRVLLASAIDTFKTWKGFMRKKKFAISQLQ